MKPNVHTTLAIIDALDAQPSVVAIARLGLTKDTWLFHVRLLADLGLLDRAASDIREDGEVPGLSSKGEGLATVLRLDRMRQRWLRLGTDNDLSIVSWVASVEREASYAADLIAEFRRRMGDLPAGALLDTIAEMAAALAEREATIMADVPDATLEAWGVGASHAALDAFARANPPGSFVERRLFSIATGEEVPRPVGLMSSGDPLPGTRWESDAEFRERIAGQARARLASVRVQSYRRVDADRLGTIIAEMAVGEEREHPMPGITYIRLAALDRVEILPEPWVSEADLAAALKEANAAKAYTFGSSP